MKSERRLPAVAWVIAAVCVAITTWIGAGADNATDAFSFTGLKGDYYSLLVSGFTRGHLYMNVEADPGLGSPDQKVREHSPTLQDANYYKGHFYLYYGVAPAVLLLLPYRLLTGQDLGTNVACLVFWLIGFGAALAWLRNWWRDFGPERGRMLASVIVVLLAFFPATTFLVRRSMFYELPLAAGFAFLSIFLAAIYEVVRGRRNLTMLATASASLGLAVGCHPNFVLLLPLLGWAALFRANGPYGGIRPMRARAAAAVLPAAAIGGGLAWYNFARFGSVFEFGFRYGQNSFFTVKQSLFVPHFLWANLKWYFLTPPAITPYFPFVFPGNNTFRPEGYQGAEAMHGQLPATLLCAWIAAGVFTSGRPRDIPSALRRFSVALVFAFAVSLLFVGFLQIRANRYMADFETPLSWLMASWGIWTWLNMGTRAWAKIWRAGFMTLTLVGSSFYLLAAIQQFDLFRYTRTATNAALSRALNVPYSWLYRAGATQPGLVAMKVHFKAQKDTVYEALLTTGTPGYSDSVNVSEYPGSLVRFSFNHKGYGGPDSGIIPIDLSLDHEIEISMGSFFPPAEDSYFKQLPEGSAWLLKRLAYLRMDGKVIISAMMTTYEAPPWSTQIGMNETTETEFKRTFSGTISDAHIVPTVTLLEMLNFESDAGILHYRIQFPARPPLSGLPLIGVGRQGDGNLVFAKARGGTQYEVDMDDWGYGVLVGKPFEATPGEHDLQIVLGPILVRSPLPPSWKGTEGLSSLSDRIIVSLDGKVLGNFKVVHHLKQFGTLTPGANPQGFSTAEAKFGGTFRFFPMVDSDVRDLLDRATQSSAR
jgi:hypothetical protein